MAGNGITIDEDTFFTPLLGFANGLTGTFLNSVFNIAPSAGHTIRNEMDNHKGGYAVGVAGGELVQALMVRAVSPTKLKSLFMGIDLVANTALNGLDSFDSGLPRGVASLCHTR